MSVIENGTEIILLQEKSL